MLLVNKFMLVISLISLSNLVLAKDLVLTEKQKDKGSIESYSRIKIDQVKNVEKEGWRKYKVALGNEITYTDKQGEKKTWIKDYNVRFKSEKKANRFYALANSDKQIDFYINVVENPYNYMASQDVCAAGFVGLFCRSQESVKVISYTELDSELFYVYDLNEKKMIELEDYLDDNGF